MRVNGGTSAQSYRIFFFFLQVEQDDFPEDPNHHESGGGGMEIEAPSFFPPLMDSSAADAKGAQQWRDTITDVGQWFSGVHEFRETLRKYAIAHQFAFWYKKNDSHRMTVKCKSEGCPWRIHASRLSTTQLICIKKMNPGHTCEGSSATNDHQATRSWVASIIKEKLKVSPNYKPKDIVSDIYQARIRDSTQLLPA